MARGSCNSRLLQPLRTPFPGIYYIRTSRYLSSRVWRTERRTNRRNCCSIYAL